MMRVYLVYIRPILEYNSVITISEACHRAIERVQRCCTSGCMAMAHNHIVTAIAYDYCI